MRGLGQHKKVLQLRKYASECCFSGIGLGPLGVGGGGSAFVAPVARLNSLRRQVGGSSQALVTFCDLSRSMCKPVYDIAGKPNQSYYSPQPVRMPSPSPYYSSSPPVVGARAGSLMAEAMERFPDAENPMAAMIVDDMNRVMASGAAQIVESS